MPPTITSAVAGIILVTSTLAAGPRDEVEAVATRRGKTVLSKVALSMKPGTWAEVPCDLPEGLMRVATGRNESGKLRRYHIAGWTDDGHWDSHSGQFLYIGFRKQLKFIAYSESENQWRTIPGPFGWNPHTAEPGKGPFVDPRTTQFGHVYGKNAFDPQSGAFYHKIGGHTYRYNLANGRWTRFQDDGPGMSIEFFPGLGLMSHTSVKNRPGVGRLAILDEEHHTWKPLAEVPFTPYHALARYNPRLDEMLLIAGNDLETVVKVDAQGKVARLADTPLPMTIRHGKLLVDPASARYLLFQHDELYELDSVRNKYRRVDDYEAPFGRYEMPVPAAIGEYGVIMFIDQKLRLYKHDAK